MNRRLRSVLTLIVMLLVCRAGFAWTTIGDGIEYQEYTLSDPNNLFVTRLLRSNTKAIIDLTMANGSNASNETVPAQVSDNDDSVFFDGDDWGPRYDIIAAVNGDLYLSGGVSRGIRISNGWYASEINSDANIYGAFGWTTDRQPIMSGYPNATQTMNITFTASGTSYAISGINTAPASNEICIFTPQNGLTTGTSASAPVTEVVVQLTSPNIVSPSPSGVAGYVKEVKTVYGSTTIPFDCVVLSAKGVIASKLRTSSIIGAQVNITTSIDSYETDGTTSIGSTWANAIMGISGSQVVLEHEVVKSYPSVTLMTDRHPRTAVAFNDTYVFFVVCDGRHTGVSQGMTGVELGTFCRDTLGATDALNLDGGGSSTMVVNGSVKNICSDGSPRAVANALIMANVKPKQTSSKFTAGQQVTVTGTTVSLRRGPGTVHPAITTEAQGAVGTITSHRLGGIMTKGEYWWQVDFDGTTGWMSESYLAVYGNTGPSSVTVTDEGAYTPSLTTLSATWTAASDGDGVAGYQYAVGTTNSSTDAKDWTDAGNVLSVVDSSLTLAEGSTYYILVRAIDNAGYTGETSASDGILAAPGIDKIGSAFSSNNLVPFSLRDKTATASETSSFWIEESDRTAAVQVVSDTQVSEWDKVSVAGYLDVVNGSRVFVADTVQITGTSDAIAPLGMLGRDIGGNDFNSLTPGITGGRSLYNIGLLVRCWGDVRGINVDDPSNKYYYLYDGSLTSGLLVRCGNANPPELGFAIVNGIVCSEVSGDSVVPYLSAK